MPTKLIVKDQITINAPVDVVWEVLSKAKFYEQWDELPEDFEHEELKKGNIIDWVGYSTLFVKECLKNKSLKMSLFLPRVKLDPKDYDIHYHYKLSKKRNKTILKIEIGDFSPLPNAQNYFTSSTEFAEKAKEKIKTLAENMVMV